MRKLTVLICFTFLNALVYSQNIYTALRLNEESEYKTRRPKKIVEINTFYSSSRKHVDKNVKTFDDAGMLLIEERFDEEGKVDERLTYVNDTTRRLTLSRTFERWTQSGYSKETAFQTYDNNNYLIGTTDKDANGNIIRQTNLIVNGKGHPVELALLDGNGNPFGRETATYLYDQNKVVTAVVSNQERSCLDIQNQFS
jgi:hypothetical protein